MYVHIDMVYIFFTVLFLRIPPFFWGGFFFSGEKGMEGSKERKERKQGKEVVG